MRKKLNKNERLIAYKRAYDLIKCNGAYYMCNTLLEMVGIDPTVDDIGAVFNTREEKYETIAKLFPEFDLFFPDETRPSTWFRWEENWNYTTILETRLTILEFCIGIIELDLEISK